MAQVSHGFKEEATRQAHILVPLHDRTAENQSRDLGKRKAIIP